MQCVPVVYGMTVGEYAKMLVGENWFANADKLDLEVVTCLNYDHSKKYELTVSPSPNLKSMSAIYAYPTTCLFEGTTLSVGRGTDKPFQQFGSPELNGSYTYSFTPKSRPGAKNPPLENKECFGVLIGDEPQEVLRKTDGRLRLNFLIDAHSKYPQKDKFFTPFFTKLAGTTKLEDQIKRGVTEDEIKASWKEDIDKFMKIRGKYLLYRDFK